MLSATQLQNLPDPSIIETLDYEVLLSEIKADLIQYAPELEQALAFESEPALKLAQAMAYRIMLERNKANNMALSLMLAKAQQSQLDNLGALPFLNTARKILIEADLDNNIDEEKESDEAYRARLQVALEGYSTAGPEGAYIFHGLAAHPSVKDLAVSAPQFSRWAAPEELQSSLPENSLVLVAENSAGLSEPLPGDIAITVLSYEGDGSTSAEVLEAVETALNAETIRPITDRPRCIAAQIVSYQIEAIIYFFEGPDRSITMAAAEKTAESYITDNHRIGRDITRSGIYAALHQPGVQKVELLSPAADLSISNQQAAYCTNITLLDGGIAE